MDIEEYLTNHSRRSDGRFNPRKGYAWLSRHHPELLYEILSITEFLPNDVPFHVRLSCIESGIDKLKECVVCGTQFFRLDENRQYANTCSKSCAVKHSSDKRRDTIRSRYGVDHHLQRPDIIDKLKATNRQRYGVDWATQNPDVREVLSKKASCRQLTDQQKSILDDEDRVIELLGRNNWLVQSAAREIGVHYGTLIERLKRFGLYDRVNRVSSVGETQLFEWVKSLSDDAIQNKRFGKFELDVFVPSKQIAFEFNGWYWHSMKPMNYHLMKTEWCEANGIRLFHVNDYEWEDWTKRRVWKSVINHALGGDSLTIGARKCLVGVVPKDKAKEFLDHNHLQGWCAANWTFGLKFDGCWVAMASFGKARWNKKADWELVRFAFRQFTHVPGALSRLLKAFLGSFDGSIISYADRRYSVGQVYAKVGFDLIRKTRPSYVWVKDGVVLSRYQTSKRKLIEEGFSGNNEREIMESRGFSRVFDCGHLVFLMRA